MNDVNAMCSINSKTQLGLSIRRLFTGDNTEISNGNFKDLIL